MSFVDLATLALHRRHEMESRINGFSNKCDVAIQNVINLQTKAQGFVETLNCDPSELKDRFLNCMKHLDEYMYLVTDFNLAMTKLDEVSNTEYTPVQDKTNRHTPLSVDASPFNLIDALSEPTPSTSKTCQNQCPTEAPIRKKVPKEDQLLITFSSASCSSESVPTAKTETREKQIQCEMQREMTKLQLSDEPGLNSTQPNLPAQIMLQVDYEYSATIMHVDGPSFWVITDPIEKVHKLMTDMTNYYKKNATELSLDQVMTLTYCAHYDEESDCFYRGLFVRLTEEDMSLAEVFLVDTGEVRSAPIPTIQPLIPMFCNEPPYARCCHLAGVDLNSSDDKDVLERQDGFLKTYIGQLCSIEVDDNTSESLGVYVILQSGECLNDLIVAEQLAVSDKGVAGSEAASAAGAGAGAGAAAAGAPAAVCAAELDITGPEYTDPVEAVTGYRNRDEAEICKFYRGGPDKTCFKGPKCMKKHILLHPEGWTLDRVAVAGKCRALPLPAPGSWLRLHVTHVVHFDRFYVHLHDDQLRRKPPGLPVFGVVVPPTTLEDLVRDMNSPASRMAYTPLETIPAPGEIVAARYPPDNLWYRARVLTVTRADQNVEVMYIDYGNVVWVKEDALGALGARHRALPAQAVRCALAGVRARSACSRAWADARAQLHALLHERAVRARVIARDYDEITVEVFDDDGYSVAEQLVAGNNQLEINEYSVVDDTKLKQRVVVP